MRKIIAALLSILLSAPTGAEVFTWKDEKGNVHFGDKRSSKRTAEVDTVTIRDKYAIPPVENFTPIPYQNSQPNRTINLNAIILGLENSDHEHIRIGAITCGPAIDFFWQKGVVDLDAPAIAAPAIQSLKELGYQAENGVGRPVTPAHLALEAKIKALKMNLCPLPYDRKTTQNATYVRIEWNLIDPLSSKTLYSGFSSGTHDASHKPAVKNGTDISLSEAIASAARNLLSDQKFVAHLTPVDLNQLAQKFDQKIETELNYGAGTGTFSSKANLLKRNSVIIKTENGHGSGVVINSKGYILTNAHVIGNEQTLRIISGDQQFEGKVIRKEEVRDVALIKVEDPQHFLEGVEVAYGKPDIGTGLFVIGTPLDLANSQTITKGIVSATRTVNGQPFIQTDAAINFGNSGGPVFSESGELIALTVAGMFTRDGANLSINYLIPIEDALDKLGITSISHKNALVDPLLSSIENTEHASKLQHWLVKAYHWLNSPLLP